MAAALDDEDFLAHESLDAREFKAVEEVAYKAPTDPVILADLKIGRIVIDRLVAKGLVDKVTPTPPYLARGYDTAYQLSTLGMKVRDRGRHPKKGR